jgi:intein/homing endonuclease
MAITSQQKQIIKNCQSSVTYFLRNYGKIKHPSAGIIPFYPFSYQRRAIKAFRTNRLNIFRKCLAEGSMVWTPDGPVPIEAIKVGDIIYSFDEKLQLVRTNKVLNAWCSGSRETYEVRSKTGHRSYATKDHLYLTDDGWEEVQNITTNHRLIEIYDHVRYGIANEHEAVLLGYLLTDGSYSRDSRNDFHFTNTCWKYLLDFQKHFESRFATRLPIRLHNRAGSNKSTKNSYRIISNITEAKDWLRRIGISGDKATTKKIPKEVFSWDNKYIALLLNRMFAGDGWYSGEHCNEVGIGSESLLMLNQIKQLLSRFQIDSKLYPSKNGSVAKLRIYGTDNFNRFVHKIGIFGKTVRHRPTTNGFFNKRHKGEIKSIKPDVERKVFDLEVENDHNFIVDGTVVHNCRQAGASKIAGAFALWFAMFNNHKTILIVSRTDEDAMGFLREQIVFLFEHLPEWMQKVWKPTKLNEHEIMFPNGSRIKSLTSHPEVLRSNASSLNIIDEAAFIQGMEAMWAGGWPCATGDTLIQTADGLYTLEELARGGDPWKQHNITVATDEGYEYSDKAFVSGRQPIIRLKTKLGMELSAAKHHKVRTIDEDGAYDWKQMSDLVCGDIIISKPGTYNGNRKYLHNGRELTPDFAEILGLYIGDGTVSSQRQKRFKIVFDPQDVATRDYSIVKFNNLGFNLPTQAYAETEYDTENLRLNSCEFIELLQKNKLNSKTRPQDARIPELILRSDEEVVCAFLRGLFDSDGWCYQSSTSLKLGLSTTSEKLAKECQVLLHALGILTRRYLVEPGKVPNRNSLRYSDEPYWRVDVWDAESKLIFRQKIGFITKRKQLCLEAFKGEASYSHIDHPALVGEFADAILQEMQKGSTFRKCQDRRKWNLARIRRLGRIRSSLVLELAAEFDIQHRLVSLVEMGLHFDKVQYISNDEADTFDLSVPKNNTYLANGLVSHNTLQHGGNVIVISTTNGVGNWYWATCTEAEAGANMFNPIVINWYDMDWVIEYTDPISREFKRIAPLDGIKKCTTKEQILKYGPYWSPWLEQQYKALQLKGESHKFKQEILASFIGSGNTVLPEEVLAYIATTVKEPEMKVSGSQTYVHPISGESELLDFDFDEPEEGLWIWQKPVLAKPEKRRGNEIIEASSPAHAYVMGVDTATGKGKDFHAIEVFDIYTREQVAEFMARCLPRDLVKYIDRIGRWYNCALAVVESNNGGHIIIDQLRYDYMYPRLYRKKDLNDKPSAGTRRKQRTLKVASYGFATTLASKPILNQYLMNYIRDNAEDGYTIYSTRLLKQFHTYVRKRDRLGHDTSRTEAEEGVGNFDDLVIATGLGLVGTADSFIVDAGNMTPFNAENSFKSMTGPTILNNDTVLKNTEDWSKSGGQTLLMPITLAPDEIPEIAAQRVIDNYAVQLGGIPISEGKPIVTPQKYFYERK